MTEYQSILETFSDSATQGKTKLFLENYWLSQARMRDFWMPITEDVFGSRGHWPKPEAMPSNQNHSVLQLTGGLTLTEDELRQLQSCFRDTQDKTFAIIEDYDESNPPHRAGPPLRFEFPSKVRWKELMQGGYLSIELFQMPHKNYLVLGDSGLWGIYAANDWENPLDVLVVKKMVERTFFKVFQR